MQKINSEHIRGYTLDAFENKGRLLQPLLKLSEIDVKSSNFHYWKLNRLLLTVPDGKRAELSIVDIIWIEILKSMKKLGCSLKAMQAVHKLLFEDSYYKNHSDQNLKRNLTKILDLEKTRPLTDEELCKKQTILDTMHDPLLRNYFRWAISHLYTLVLDCIENGSSTTIRLYENGIVNISGHNAQLEIDEIDLQKLPNTYVQISLSDIVNLFFDNIDIQNKLVDVGYLSEDEQNVLSEMRKQNIKTITIHFYDQKHKIKKIECDSVGLIGGDKSLEVMKILGLKNYSGIELNTRDGKNLSFVRTDKKFFK